MLRQELRNLLGQRARFRTGFDGDGGRGFRALSRRQRWTAVAVLGGGWFLTAEPLLFLLGIAGVVNALSQAPDEGDNAMLALYAGLALILALLSRLEVPTGAI